MAFRNKASFILKYAPDILIVPECEHPDKLKFSANTPTPTDVLWFGKNQNKGLAIFSYSEYRFTLLDQYNPKFQLIIPISVTKGQDNFSLFAIWANNSDEPNARYIEQVWKAVHYYDKLVARSNTILVGDFNSNTIWDRKLRESNHSNVVKILKDKGIVSTYHFFYNQEQGAEKHPTLYMYRHKDKTYHIDYCFVSEDMLEKLQSVEIGKYKFWSKYSDHVPVIVTFKYD